MIQGAEQLIVTSAGWPSEDAALRAAAHYGGAFKRTLVRLRIGADFGERGPKSIITNAGLAQLQVQLGQRCLHDYHGLITYTAYPRPRFVGVQSTALRGVPQEQFERVFAHAIASPREVADREQVSQGLFNASFFQPSWDARLLLLVMAIEALLDPPQRSPAATEHVKQLLQATTKNPALTSAERSSLVGTLRWLLQESISHTGRNIVRERLGTRTYQGKEPGAFFTHCYSLRSRLVHGTHPFPTQEEVNSVGGDLEQFVSDLLSTDLLDPPPRELVKS